MKKMEKNKGTDFSGASDVDPDLLSSEGENRFDINLTVKDQYQNKLFLIKREDVGFLELKTLIDNIKNIAKRLEPVGLVD